MLPLFLPLPKPLALLPVAGSSLEVWKFSS